MMFHTRFNVADTVNKDKIYDRHDNVDRVSYVDSTRLIERFILEGNNLNAVRARALNAGMYSDADAMSESGGLIIPVYETDPAIIQPIVEQAEKSLKSRVATNNNDVNDDKIASNSDLAERSPDAGVQNG